MPHCRSECQIASPPVLFLSEHADIVFWFHPYENFAAFQAVPEALQKARLTENVLSYAPGSISDLKTERNGYNYFL